MYNSLLLVIPSFVLLSLTASASYARHLSTDAARERDGFCLVLDLEVVVLLLQESLGPRSFFTVRCSPTKYNYYRRVPLHARRESEDEDDKDCVICMVSTAL